MKRKKKTRDTKGIFHAKMDLIKDRNDMDLKKAEDIKKRWQECTEELYKKELHRGKAPRWRRSRTGKTLSPPQIHQKSI